MDQPDADPLQLRKSLVDLREVNRWLGGRRGAVRRVLSAASRMDRRPVVVLDVGTGAGDIPAALVARGRREGIGFRVIALDMHPVTLREASAVTRELGEISVVGGDAFELPVASRSVDIGMINTALHHFSEEEAQRVLQELERVSRVAVVVTDLARSRAALAGANLLAATVWRRHPITRHDGPWSVRAAFTVDEMRRLAEPVFGSGIAVRSEPVFRLSMVAAVGGGGGEGLGGSGVGRAAEGR